MDKEFLLIGVLLSTFMLLKVGSVVLLLHVSHTVQDSENSIPSIGSESEKIEQPLA